MSVTELQTKLIEAQQQFVNENSELLKELNATADGELTPEEEKAIGAYLVDVEGILQQVKALIQDIFR